MTAFIHTAFFQALGWAVLNSLWQMALIWIIYNAAVSVPQNLSPERKSKIASSMLFTGFAWFLFTFISILISRDNNSAIVTVNGLSAVTNEHLNNWLDAAPPYASLLYIVLLIIPVFRFIRNYRYVQVLRNHNLVKIDVEWRMFVQKVSARIGITKPVHIWVSDLISSPVTIGYLKPIVLVPLAAINNLNSQQMEAVLLHELAHIRRYDYLINLLVHVIQTILYFNPFVRAFVKTIEREREKSCDQMVMQFQYDPHNYVSALLMLEKNQDAARDMAIAASGRNDLLHRVERILNIDTKPVFTFNKLAGLFAGLLCIIVLNALITKGKPNSDNGGDYEAFSFQQPAAAFFTSASGNETAVPQTADPASSIGFAEKEMKTDAIENHIIAGTASDKKDTYQQLIAAESDETDNGEAVPALTPVNCTTTVLPELTRQEQMHVELTVEATKKVVEDVQWKEVEKSIADALTEGEKAAVKKQYNLELDKVDWAMLENKLKASYDQLNWDKINDQLGNAISRIKLDSLVELYSTVKENLVQAEKMATSNDQVSAAVPLPDVSIQKIRQSREQVQKKLVRLKAIRSKKIIHL